MSVKSVRKTTLLPSTKKYRKADLFFWTNDQHNSAAITFRFEEDALGYNWITGRRKSPSHILSLSH